MAVNEDLYIHQIVEKRVPFGFRNWIQILDYYYYSIVIDTERVSLSGGFLGKSHTLALARHF